jgi:hypothetical protein
MSGQNYIREYPELVSRWSYSSVTLREEHRLRVCENRFLRRIFGPRGRKWWEAGERCIMRSYSKYCYGGHIKKDEMGKAYSTHGT